MDMELDKRTIAIFETVLDTSTVHDENTEMIVPDASPDIMRIICAAGKAYVKEKTPREGKADVSGIVKGCVLYMAEDDSAIRKLEVSLPFNRTFDGSGLTASSQVWATAWIKSIEAREINPRKISVRANIGIAVKAYEPTQLQVCTGVADAEEYAVELKKQTVGIYAPVAIKEKSFTISDDVEIPAGNPVFASIVSNDAKLNVTDMKIIGNKAVIKGNAGVSYLYQTREGGLASCEHELPFSQIIDVEGMSEDCEMDIKLSVRGIELEAQHDLSGDTRFICVSLLVDSCVMAYYSGEVDTIEDMYSTKYELSCRFEGKVIPRFAEHITKRVNVAETIETASTVQSVIDLSVSLEPACKRREDGEESLASEAVIVVTYIGEDGGVYCASRRCTIICPLGQMSDMNYDCAVSITGKSHSGIGGNQVAVRFFADYEVNAMSSEKNVSVSAVEVDTEKSKNSQDMPSVIIKYINSDQLLWDTAKRYNTTVAEIAAANALENEEIVRAGSMLLIPKAR